MFRDMDTKHGLFRGAMAEKVLDHKDIVALSSECGGDKWLLWVRFGLTGRALNKAAFWGKAEGKSGHSGLPLTAAAVAKARIRIGLNWSRSMAAEGPNSLLGSQATLRRPELTCRGLR